MVFEKKNQKLISINTFYLRLLKHVLIAGLMVAVSISIGAIGYHSLEEMNWIDAIYNASMILTGMGPVNPMNSNSAKIFASFYALFSGVAFLSITAVMFAPFIHRLLHKMHIDIND